MSTNCVAAEKRDQTKAVALVGQGNAGFPLVNSASCFTVSYITYPASSIVFKICLVSRPATLILQATRCSIMLCSLIFCFTDYDGKKSYHNMTLHLFSSGKRLPRCQRMCGYSVAQKTYCTRMTLNSSNGSRPVDWSRIAFNGLSKCWLACKCHLSHICNTFAVTGYTTRKWANPPVRGSYMSISGV